MSVRKNETPAQGATDRGVSEIVHFTTDKGLMGSLVKRALLSRRQVGTDPDLHFIFLNVWPLKVPEWNDYISLSVSRINRGLFHKAEQNLGDRWWAVLSFDVSILDHPEVVFATTNNSYTEVCQRSRGLDGFEALFADEVPWGWQGSVHRRPDPKPDHYTTDPQAEVLYQGAVSLDHLLRIYVAEAEHRRLIYAWCSAFEVPVPEVDVRPEMFA